MKVRMLSELEIGTRFQYQEHGPFHELTAITQRSPRSVPLAHETSSPGCTSTIPATTLVIAHIDCC